MTHDERRTDHMEAMSTYSPAGVFPRLGLHTEANADIEDLTLLDEDDLHALRHEALLTCAAGPGTATRRRGDTADRARLIDMAVTAELHRRELPVPPDVCAMCHTELRGEWRWPHRCPSSRFVFDPANSRHRAAVEQVVWQAHTDGVTDPKMVLLRLTTWFPGLSQADLDAVPHLWGLVHDTWAEPIPAGLDTWADSGFPPSAAAQWDRAGVWDPRVALVCLEAGITSTDAARASEPSTPEASPTIGEALQRGMLTVQAALAIVTQRR